jgi:NADPH:quinone reductase-like Zn-dependent oxidoreductase
MKKIIYQRYGINHESMIADTTPPNLSNGNQVLVKIKAASLNPVDWKIRQGEMKIFTGSSFPRGMGSDFSGEILDVGSEVTHFKKGDRVFGFLPFKSAGSFSEIVLSDVHFVALMPDDMTFEQACCLPMAGAAALTALEFKSEVKKGDRVFIGGCTGGVGHLAVQFAKSRGAIVVGSCSSSDFEKAKNLGVDEVYNYANIENEVISECNIVFDTSGKMTRKAVLNILPSAYLSFLKRGTFLDLNPRPSSMIRSLFSGVYKVVITKVTPSLIQRLSGLALSKSFTPIVSEKFPFQDSLRVIEEIESGKLKTNGKVVFTF